MSPLRPFCPRASGRGRERAQVDLNRLRKRLAFIPDLLRKLPGILIPRGQEVRAQRMCPFCGLITPRFKAFCLECGKSLNPA
jgi:hypothetical protein